MGPEEDVEESEEAEAGALLAAHTAIDVRLTSDRIEAFLKAMAQSR